MRKIFWNNFGVILIGLMFLVIGQLFGQNLSDAFLEADTNFTYQGKPIHPGLVNEFSSWISDKGFPTTISVDIAAPHGNEYFEDDAKIDEDKNVCIDEKDENDDKTGAYFCYRRLGKLNNGLHILKTWESGGGSGVFTDLCFVRIDKDKGTFDGQPYERLLMVIAGTYGLGEEYSGEAEILTDRVIVKKLNGEKVELIL